MLESTLFDVNFTLKSADFVLISTFLEKSDFFSKMGYAYNKILLSLIS